MNITNPYPSSSPGLLRNIIFVVLVLAIVILANSCASTVFYRNGERVAAFQGNMKDVVYQDGGIRWSASDVDHSSATIAGGNAVSKGIISGGTAVATSGLTKLIP